MILPDRSIEGTAVDADAQIFAALYPSLRRYAAVVGSLSDDPDDLVQEAVARTLRQNKLAELDSPAAYLRRSISNLVINGARSDTSDRSRNHLVVTDDEWRDVYPSDLGLLEQLSPTERGADQVLGAARVAEPISLAETDVSSQRSWIVAIAATCVVAAVVGALLLADSSPDIEVATRASSSQPTDGEPTSPVDQPRAGPNSSAAPSPALSFAHPPDALPRVVIDRPGFRIEAGSEQRTTGLEEEPPIDYQRAFIYQNPLQGFDGSSITLQLLQARFDFEGDAVEINGVPGLIADNGSLLSVVAWNDGSGELVMTAIRVPRDQLIKAAASTVRTTEGDLEVSALPPGVELVSSGSRFRPDLVLSGEFEYQLDDVRGDLSITSGSVAEFVNLVFERLDEPDEASELRHGRIGETDVALVTSSGKSVSALWWAEDLIFELRGNYGSLDELQVLLGDLGIVDEATWQTMVPAG